MERETKIGRPVETAEELLESICIRITSDMRKAVRKEAKEHYNNNISYFFRDMLREYFDLED